MSMSPILKFILNLPSLVNSTVEPTGRVLGSALVHSHLPTRSLALSGLSSARALTPSSPATTTTASSRIAFILVLAFGLVSPITQAATVGYGLARRRQVACL